MCHILYSLILLLSLNLVSHYQQLSVLFYKYSEMFYMYCTCVLYALTHKWPAICYLMMNCIIIKIIIPTINTYIVKGHLSIKIYCDLPVYQQLLWPTSPHDHAKFNTTLKELSLFAYISTKNNKSFCLKCFTCVDSQTNALWTLH